MLFSFALYIFRKCTVCSVPSGVLGGLPMTTTTTTDGRTNEPPGPPEHIFVMDVYLPAIFIKLHYGMYSSFSSLERRMMQCATRMQSGLPLLFGKHILNVVRSVKNYTF